MFEIGAGMIFFQAFVLMGLLVLFARQEADYEYTKVVFVTCGIVVGNFMLALLLTPKIGPLVLLLVLAYTAFMLEKFCWVSWFKAVVIAALYFALTVGFEIARVRFITGEWRTPKTAPEPEGWKFPEMDAATKEGIEVLESMRPALSDPPDDVGDEPAGQTKTGVAPANPVPVAPGAAFAPDPAPPPAPRPLSRSPAPRTPVPDPVVAVPADRLDWSGARSMLRLRGTLKDAQGLSAAMVATSIVSVGSAYSATWQGVRYTWRLDGLEGGRAAWRPVGAELAP